MYPAAEPAAQLPAHFYSSSIGRNPVEKEGSPADGEAPEPRLEASRLNLQSAFWFRQTNGTEFLETRTSNQLVSPDLRLALSGKQECQAASLKQWSNLTTVKKYIVAVIRHDLKTQNLDTENEGQVESPF